MNSMRKKAAVAKYGPLKLGGASLEELKKLLEADDKKYPAEEVDEILQALMEYTGDTGDQGGGNGNPPPAGTDQPANLSQAQQAETKNKKYELWDIELNYQEVKVPGQAKPVRQLKEGDAAFTKVKKVKDVTTNPEHAETLNSQSVNTKQRLYLVN